MESTAHLRLKRLALAFLRERGCLVVGTEVRCPIARWRVDVAGYLDVRGQGDPALDDDPGAADAAWRRRPPRTIFIECKQSRSDFLRDRRDRERLLGERRALERLARTMERDRLRATEPDLRRAGTLFPELMPDAEEWDWDAARSPAYRDLLRRLRRIDRRIHGETKFCLAARYRLADRLYVAAPRGLLRPRELPPGWGLLECAASALEADDARADLFGESLLTLRVPAPVLRPREEYRQRLLRNIAVAASAAFARRELAAGA